MRQGRIEDCRVFLKSFLESEKNVVNGREYIGFELDERLEAYLSDKGFVDGGRVSGLVWFLLDEFSRGGRVFANKEGEFVIERVCFGKGCRYEARFLKGYAEVL